MSITRNEKIQCDGCGKFIPLLDLVDGKASHNYVLPDSESSVETFESLCRGCTPTPAEGKSL